MTKWTAVRVMAIVVAALVVTAGCSQTPEVPKGDEVTTVGGHIEGTVTDKKGNPLTQLRLGIVSGTVPFPEIASVTNSDGFYSFPAIQPGSFEVAVYDTEGNVLRQGTVDVRKGEASSLNFSVDAASTLSPLTPAATEFPKFGAVAMEDRPPSGDQKVVHPPAPGERVLLAPSKKPPDPP